MRYQRFFRLNSIGGSRDVTGEGKSAPRQKKRDRDPLLQIVSLISENSLWRPDNIEATFRHFTCILRRRFLIFLRRLAMMTR